MTDGDYIGLVVGINDYPHSQPLESAVRDARDVAALLARDGDAERSRRWDLDTILFEEGDTAETVTRTTNVADQILLKVKELTSREDLASKNVLFWFSGHGSAPIGRLRLDTPDSSLLSQEVIDLFNECPAKTVTIILDCCFAGSVGDEPQVFESGAVRTGRPNAAIRENLAVLTSCRGFERAADGDGNSPFTTLLLAGLKGGAADHQGAVTIVDLFSYISGYFQTGEQRPQLKINMTGEPLVLRAMKPRVPEMVLNKLTTWFPTVDHQFQLTPAHEGKRDDWPQTDLDEFQVEFDEIGKVRNLGMIDSVTPDMPHYWVALKSGYIKLSPVGEWYWHKVDKRRRGS